jgi:hypothetical protein
MERRDRSHEIAAFILGRLTDDDLLGQTGLAQKRFERGGER